MFQVGAAVARSWEGQGSSLTGAELASAPAVFDALAEACFASFEEENSARLASALGAMWSADGALHRASAITIRASICAGSNGTILSHTNQSMVASGVDLDGHAGRGDALGNDLTYANTAGTSQAVDGIAGTEGVEEGELGDERIEARREDTGDGTEGTGGGAETVSAASVARRASDTTGGELRACGVNDAWFKDSKTVDVIQRLTPSCREYAVADGGEGTGVVEDGATQGRDSAVVSEAGGDVVPTGLSLLDLGEALADGVGPEAAADILAACPRLLEGMPPKVRQTLLCNRRVNCCIGHGKAASC